MAQIEVFKFTADYCPSCKQQKAVLDKIKGDFPDVTITEVAIDTEAGQAIAQDFQIGSLPVLATRVGHRLAGGHPESRLRSFLREVSEPL